MLYKYSYKNTCSFFFFFLRHQFMAPFSEDCLCNTLSQTNGGDTYPSASVRHRSPVCRWPDATLRVTSRHVASRHVASRHVSFLYHLDGSRSLRSRSRRWLADLRPLLPGPGAAQPEVRVVSPSLSQPLQRKLFMKSPTEAVGPVVLNTGDCVSKAFTRKQKGERVSDGQCVAAAVLGCCWQVWSSSMQVESRRQNVVVLLTVCFGMAVCV